MHFKILDIHFLEENPTKILISAGQNHIQPDIRSVPMPDLDAYLQNPTPDNGVRFALDSLLHDDDTPFLNIDPEQTLDPNDSLTSEVPSPINSQISHASFPNIVVPYKNDRRSGLHP